jgi:hypothetical protein
VVNKARDIPLQLQADFPAVDFHFRENVGLNIGAWEYGWRQSPAYDAYVFLQEECLILRKNWLRAYLKKSRRGRGRIVGEYMITVWKPWKEWGEAVAQSLAALPEELRERLDNWQVPFIMDDFARHGVEPQATPTHVQALVICTTRAVLEAIGGFLIGQDYRESVASELAFSQKAMALGYPIEQVSPLPFEYIIHPQYMTRRFAMRSPKLYLKGVVKRRLSPRTVQLLKPVRARLKMMLGRA